MTGRKSVIWGAVAWATLSVVIFLIQFLTSSAAPMVNVRWAEDVDLAQREQLEQAFLLEPFVNREATTWTYELLDTSPDNIQALVEHASVSDTHHIERTEFRLSDEAELGDTSWWAAQRVRMLRPVAWVLWPVIPAFFVLVATGVGLLGLILLLGRMIPAGLLSFRNFKGPHWSHWRQSWNNLDRSTVIVAAMSVCLVAIGALRVATLETAPTVFVRWADQVSVDERTRLERTYSLRLVHEANFRIERARRELLTQGVAPAESSEVAYELFDTSRRNVRALVQNPSAADTQNINRASYDLEEDVRPGTSVTWLAHRVSGVRLFTGVLWPGVLYLWLLVVVWTFRSPMVRGALWVKEVFVREGTPTEVTLPVLTAVVFGWVWLVELVSISMLGGDDHNVLWMASALYYGDIPFRDFYDLGVPLNVVLSWFGQLVTGHRMIGEWLLGTLLEAIALTVAFRLAVRASGSVMLGLLVLLIASPLLTAKLYHYPKVFSYPMVLWFCWRYIDCPTTKRLVVLAGGVTAAYLIRHDHGAQLGIIAGVAVLAAHYEAGWRSLWLPIARLAVALTVLMAPYLLWGAIAEGPIEYFRTRFEVARTQGNFNPRATPSLVPDLEAPSGWLVRNPLRVPVAIDWAVDVDDRERRQLERRYGLVDGTRVGEQTYAGLDHQVGSRVVDGTRVEQGTWAYLASRLPRGTAIGRYDETDNVFTEPRILGVRGLNPDTGLKEVSGSSPVLMFDRLGQVFPWLRVSILPRWFHYENAGLWLYGLFTFLPWMLLGVLTKDFVLERWRGRPVSERFSNERAVMVVTAICLLVMNLALLKRPGYALDVVGVALIAGAWLLGRAFFRNSIRQSDDSSTVGRRLGQRSLAGLSRVSAVVLLILTTVATITHGEWFRHRVWTTSPSAVLEIALREINALSTYPPIDGFAPADSKGDRAVIRWMHECTRPEDRIWNLSNDWPLPYQTERRAVHHLHWSSNFRASDRAQQDVLQWLEGESVPVVMSMRSERPFEFLERYPLLHEHVSKKYSEASSPTLRANQAPEEKEANRRTYLMVANDREPTGRYEPLDLPCFR